MKKLIISLLMVMAFLTAGAQKPDIYFLCEKSGETRALKVSEYSTQNSGTIVGVLVTNGTRNVMLTRFYSETTYFKSAKEYIDSQNGLLVLPTLEDMNLLAEAGYRKVNEYIFFARMESKMETKSGLPLNEDIYNDSGIWLADGSFITAGGQVGRGDSNTACRAIYLFNPQEIKNVKMPQNTALVTSKAAGPLKATLTVTPTDRSGANYRNRPGHIYMVEDVKVTIQNMNGNMPTDPAVVGYGEVMGVSLEMILPNGNSVEVGDWQRLELIPHYPNDQAPYYDDSKTFNCRFLNMWRKLHTGYGSKVFKYRYSVKYRGKIIGKTPVRQITIINEPKPVMNVRIVK